MSAPARTPQGAAPPGAAKARLRLWLRLLKLQRRIEGELRERLRREFHSTLPRFDVMAALDRAPDGLRMSELSGVLRVSNGNVTGIVDRLVAEGLVARTPVAGDRRAFRVRLTEAGRAHFATLAAAHEAWVDGLLDGVDAEGATALAGQLNALIAHIDRKDRKHGKDRAHGKP